MNILTEEELIKKATECGHMLNEGTFSLRQSKDIEDIIISHRELYKELDVYKTIALEFVTEQTARKIYALLRSGQ